MKYIFSIILATFCITLSAQQQSVGLVLSGGGAKGLYHVGILKALEENGIGVDYVSGASMGAIVGAMYAGGWSPQRMWDFFLTDSVSVWLSGKIPDEYRYYYRQFEPTPEMINLRINPNAPKIKEAIQLPTNVISPYLLDLAIINMLGPASAAARGNFDSLMIPFRCVASDVYNKKLVTFDSGSLPFAVRTSMTIPLAFKPLMRDSVLLYDGGVYNNFPWQSLKRDFDPDIIIGGVCAGNNKNPAKETVMDQIMVMIMDSTNYSLPDSLDILIRHKFTDIGTLEYGKAETIMQTGYDDAMAQMPSILERVTTRRTPQQLEDRRAKFRAKIKPLIFDSVVIDGLSESQLPYVRRQLGLHLHHHFTYEYFAEKYLKIISGQIFTGEFPSAVYNPTTGYYTLYLKMATQPSLRFAIGGNISSSSFTQGYLSVEYSHTTNASSTYGVRGYFGGYYISGQAYGRHDLYTNFPFYVDYAVGYESYDMDSYASAPYYRGRDWRFKRQENMWLTTSVAIPVLGNSAFRGRLTAGRSLYDYYEGLHTSIDKASFSSFNFANLTAEVETNTLNFPIYPSLGKLQLFSINYVVGEEYYRAGSDVLPSTNAGGNNIRGWAKARYMREQYCPIGSWFTLGYMVDFTVSTHPSFANGLISAMTSPRFTPTPESQWIFMTQYASPSYLGFGIAPTFNFIKKGTLFLKTYAYMYLPQELVLENSKWHVPSLPRINRLAEYIFGGALVYQSPLGPASISVNKYTTGPSNWSVQFNFGYTLFGRRHF